MSDAHLPTKDAKQLTKLPDDKTYVVGHGRPPVGTRFKPGQSGNPKGRPKGSKHRTSAPSEERLISIILAEAYRTIKVNDGNKQVTVPMAQAVIRSVAVNAAKGNTRAQRLFAEVLRSTEASYRQKQDEWLETAITYKVEWEIEFERRRKLGMPLPELLPHPDDIIIDFRNSSVAIRGPMSKEELMELQHFLCRRAEFEEEVAWLKAKRKRPKTGFSQQFLEREIAYSTRVLEIIGTIIDQRASPNCIQRLLQSKQITIDPSYRNPDIERRRSTQLS